jgi:glycosyltransferase involved in cell wall biosynthesis
LTVARLHPDKGLDIFIEGVASSGAVGWICGDGPLRAELEACVAGTSVRLLGYRYDVQDLLGAADMFALPSAGEAYGIAVVEAIAAGLPVVVTAAGAMPEIAGDAGIVVDPGDRRAFAEAVQRLVSDGELRVELAARAQRRAPPDNDDLIARIGSVYDEVVR